MQYISCNFCGLQYQQQHIIQFDTPVYHQNIDSIKLLSKKICKNCSNIILNIQSYVKESQLQYSNHRFKSHIFQYYPFLQITTPKKSIQLTYATSKQHLSRRLSSQLKNLNNIKRMSLPQRLEQAKQQPHPYILWLVQEIINKNYLTMQNLCKTVQYLIYLSSDKKMVSSQQRHQKIKNIILFLSQKIYISIQQLPDLLFMVNYLLCIMDASKTINVIIQLSNIFIYYPHLLNWKTLLIDHLQRPNVQTPLSPATFDMKTALISIDRLWVKIQYIIDVSRRGESIFREGLIRISKIDQVIDIKEYKKKLGENLKILARKEELELFNQEQLQLLYLLKQQRNNLNLIMKQIIQQQQNMRIHLTKLQHKFRLQKDQYIQKIIKLNNKIQQLQSKLKDMTDQNNKTLQKQQIQSIPKIEQYDILQQIINRSNIGIFNHRHHISKYSQNIDVQTQKQKYIIEQICKMQEYIVKIGVRLKIAQDQKNRLVDIIARKEERYLGVIMEKDTIIERYQQALWTLENGIVVSDGPLANRIQYIMQIFDRKGRKERQRQRDIEQLQPQIGVQRQDIKKQKNCQIY